LLRLDCWSRIVSNECTDLD